MRPRDTSPEAWEFYLELHRRMSPGEKLARVLQMSEDMNRICEAGLRQKFPDASERWIFLRRAQITLGRELFDKVYGAEFASLV
jgi:hypothetical protein